MEDLNELDDVWTRTDEEYESYKEYWDAIEYCVEQDML